MIDKTAEPKSISPVLAADWSNSRWGPEDQRGNGNLMTRQKVLEAVSLIKTGEIVSLGMPYDSRMPIAPGRAYALRMPGGPTGGPYGSKSRTIWNDEFIATEIGQIGTQMDALGHLGCMCGARGDKTNMLFYNGNRLSDMWSPYGLIRFDLATRCSCARATDQDGILRHRPSTTGRRASASNARAGFPVSKYASWGLTILPLRSFRRSTLRSFTPATNISSWKMAFISTKA
jgi:hypothetical protein